MASEPSPSRQILDMLPAYYTGSYATVDEIVQHTKIEKRTVRVLLEHMGMDMMVTCNADETGWRRAR